MTTEVAARLALLALPGVGPARLRWLLADGSAVSVVGDLRAGRLPSSLGKAPAGVTIRLVEQWTVRIRSIEPEALLAANQELGDLVLDPGHALWPFTQDPEPPALLFARGEVGLLGHRPLVAIVGTRRCSAIGRRVATQLGAELSEAGVGVVSGLASGIDGAAHQGVLAVGGAPLGVVGTGLDVVYPAQNRDLWWRVGADGLLVSEAARSTGPERWRFPARNRLIAGLASVIVVVESHAAGGSLHTVSEGVERGKVVMAVPGSVTSPASVGSNQLLVEGCAPVTSTEDVLDALGHERPASMRTGSGSGDSPGDPEGLPVSALARSIFDQVLAGALHVDELLPATRATVPEVLAAVNELVTADLVVLDGSMVSLRQQPPL